MSNVEFYNNKPWMSHYQALLSEVGEVKASQHQLHDNLPALIQAAGQQYSTQTAFTTCMPNGMNGRLSYGEVEEMSDAFAVYLRECVKLAPGSRVAVQMPNCLSLPVVVFGVLKAGCILVNVNPLYTKREMEHQFNDSGAQVLVIVDMFIDKLEAIIERTDIQQVVVTSVAQWFPPVVKGVLQLVLKYWNRVIPNYRLEVDGIDQALKKGREAKATGDIDVRHYWQHLGRADTALLQYTGGTTGVSKGAELTHGNLISNLEQVDAVAAVTSSRARSAS